MILGLIIVVMAGLAIIAFGAIVIPISWQQSQFTVKNPNRWERLTESRLAQIYVIVSWICLIWIMHWFMQ